MSRVVHVAAGVIRNALGEILIARRPGEKHMGGYWEFPGGKVEPGERAADALRREVQEEVDLELDDLRPLIQIPWNYKDKQILLDVFSCRASGGEASGKEGQEIRWLSAEALQHYRFPPANKGILQALTLPEKLLITAEVETASGFYARLDRALENGIRLVQLRDFPGGEDGLTAVLDQLSRRRERYGSDLKVLFNIPPSVARQHAIQHLHLKSCYLASREVAEMREQLSLLSASVHNQEELELANQLAVDFILISPVQTTGSHPATRPLGWEIFQQLVAKAQMPVFALGGLNEDDISKAQGLGAQGVAAISAFWQ